MEASLVNVLFEDPADLIAQKLQKATKVTSITRLKLYKDLDCGA